MVQQQTLADYRLATLPFSATQRGAGYFAAYPLAEFCPDTAETSALYGRKDFYKIVLVSGHATYEYSDHREELVPGQAALVFTNRQVPYRWELHSGVLDGYGCVFTEEFLPRPAPVRSPSWAVFDPDEQSFFRLTATQAAQFAALFEKMLAEQQSNYPHKHELLYLYVLECIHEALKLRTSAARPDATAASRLTAGFRALLAQQFPIVASSQRVVLRTPQAFADRLAVHVNYLSRVLRATTGKNTSQLLAERLVQEARALLLHTDWPIGHISYSLGFEEATHFTQFFRRHTGYTPSQLRQV